MSKDKSSRLSALSSRDIYDLVRAGVLLVMTVGLALVVPPKVWGAEAPVQTPAQVELTK